MSRLAKALIYLFVFMVAWENIIIVPGVGTAAKLLGLFAGCIGLAAVLARNKIRHHPFLIAGLLFVAWSWASWYWSVDPQSTRQRLLTYTQLWLMSWLVYQYGERHYLQRLLQAYVLGAWVAAVATFWAYIRDSEVAYHRFAAPGFDPNDLSFYLVLAIPLAAYVGFVTKGRWAKILFFSYIPFGVLAVFLTASRAGALGLAVAILYVFYPLRMLNWKWRLSIVLLLATGLCYVFTHVPQESYARLATIGTEFREGTLNKRLGIWAAGLAVFGEHPILGTGAGTFRTVVAHYLGYEAAPHNVFLTVAVEGGLPAAMLWLVLMTCSFLGVLGLQRHERYLWCIVFLVLTLAFLSLNFEWRKVSWLLLAVAAASSTVRDDTNRNSMHA